MRAAALLCGFLVAATATAASFLRHRDLPLVDLPNHTARHWIAAHPEAVAEFYAYDLAFIPNAAVDLLWALTGRGGDVYAFVQAVHAGYAIALVAAIMLLARIVHGRWTLWSLAGAFLVHNATFFWGFQNFAVTLPIAIGAFALWLAAEGWRPWARAVLFVPIALTLYWMHLFGLGVLAAAVLGREGQRLVEAREGRRAHLLRVLPGALPFLLCAAALALGLSDGQGNPMHKHAEFGGIGNRLQALYAPAMPHPAVSDAPVFTGASAAFVVAMLALLVFGALGRGPLRIAPVLRGPLLVLAALTVLTPTWLYGVFNLQLRFPPAFFALAIAGTRLSVSRPRAVMVGVVFFALFAGRILAFDRLAAQQSADADALRSLAAQIPAGARVLPGLDEAQPWAVRHRHLQGLVVIEAQAFVPTLFLGVHGLTLTDAYRGLGHPAFQPVFLAWLYAPETAPPMEIAFGWVFWRNWERDFDYLLMMNPVSEGALDRAPVARIDEAGPFSLWRIEKPEGG